MWGRFGGLQLGSNEAAPLDIQQQDHAMQLFRHIDSYCLVLQHGVPARVANANENDVCIVDSMLTMLQTHQHRDTLNLPI